MGSPSDSFNGQLGSLVSAIRQVRSVPANDVPALVPQLHRLQDSLNSYNEDIGEPERNYIDEIMAELDIEDVIEENLLEEAYQAIRAMVAALHNKDIDLDQFAVDYYSNQAVYWLSFTGYSNGRQEDAILNVARECFRATAYKYDVVFLDQSRVV